MENLTSIKHFLATLSLNRLLPALIILTISLLVIRVLMRLFDEAWKHTKLDRSFSVFIRTAFKFLLYFIAALIVASSLGFDVTSLIALLSVVSLALSLAVQGTLSNIAGGLMVLSAHPFKVGDFVEVGGLNGTVVTIGLIYTELSTPDNKQIFVPNNEISASKIINYTQATKRRVDLKFTASYDAPVEKVKAALTEAASVPELLPDEELFVRVNNYGDSAIEYVVRAWTTCDDYWKVYYDIIENAKTIFDAQGIEMTYPHLNVHLKNDAE